MEDNNTTVMKRCSRCHQDKPLTDYYPYPKAKCGVGSHCKNCHYQLSKEISGEWIKRKRKEDEQYRLEFNDDSNKRMKERYQNDMEYQERQKKYMLEYYRKNRDAILAKQKAAKENKQKEKEAQ